MIPIEPSNVQQGLTPISLSVIAQEERASDPFIPELDDKEIPLTPLPKKIVKTWKERGDFFLSRKEADPAIEAYTKALEEAESGKTLVEVASCLKHLGQAFLEKEKWALAAKLISGAFSLAPDGENRRLLPSLMAEVERRFLEKECNVKIEKHLDPQSYIKARDELRSLRDIVRQGIERGDPAEKILRDFSNKIAHFLEGLLNRIYLILGKPPCEFAIIALGSLARKEMNPYSDLEFAILVSKNTKITQAYFQKLTKILEIKVINLGETEIKILMHGRESPTTKGFSYDDGGNTPLGKLGYVELIHTPYHMAQFQQPNFYQEDLILSNVLKGSALLLGKATLFKDYRKAMEEILNHKETSSERSLGEIRALDLMAGHLIEFEPQIDQRKEETPLFNIKAELYRLPNFLIGSLADFVGIADQNSWKKLKRLRDKNILSKEATDQLAKALNDILRLRIRSHLHYGRECEEAFHPSIKRKNAEIIAKTTNVFILSDEDILQIIEIYRVLFPLHRIFKEFCQKKDLGIFKQAHFYDDSPLAQGLAYVRLCDYEKARDWLQKAVRLDPNDPQAQLQFSNMLRRTADYTLAKEHGLKALSLAKNRKDENLLISAHNNLGLIYSELGDYDSALVEHRKGLKITKKTYLFHPLLRGISFNNIGLALLHSGKAKRAMRYFRKAYKNAKLYFGSRDPTVALTLCNLGGAALSTGKPKRALKYIKKAWKLFRHNAEDDRVNAPLMRSNLGNIYYELGNYRKAVHHCGEALALNQKIFGYEHPDTAKYLGNRAIAQLSLGETETVIASLEEALKIAVGCLGAEHPDIIFYLKNLGLGYHSLGTLEQAIDSYNKAWVLSCKVLGNKHPMSLQSAYKLARAYIDIGQYQKGLKLIQEVITQYRVDAETNPLDLAKGLNVLGAAFNAKKNYQEAIECFEEALAINTKVLGEMHPEAFTTLSNIGTVLHSKGNYEEALKKHLEAVRVARIVYPKGHQQLASLLLNLTGTYFATNKVESAKEGNAEALKIFKKTKGPKCREVAHCLHNLAMIEKNEGNLDKAREYSDQACDILETNSYRPLPLDIKVLEDNILILEALGAHDRAIKVLKKLLKLQRNMYGTKNQTIAVTYDHLGLAYKNLGNYQKALDYNLKALNLLRHVHQNDQLDLALCLKNIAYTSELLNKKMEAKAYYSEAVAIYRKIGGPNNSTTADILISLARLMREEKDFVNAATTLKEAMPILEATSGEESQNVAINMNNLASDLKNAGELQESLESFQKSLAINQKVLGKTHPQIAISYGNLSNCCKTLEQFDKALEYGQESLRIFNLQQPQDFQRISSTLSYLINLCKQIKQIRKAAEYTSEAIVTQEKIHGKKHNNIMNLLFDLSLLWLEIDDTEKAIKYGEFSLEMAKEILEDKHAALIKLSEHLGKIYQKRGNHEEIYKNGEEQLYYMRAIAGEEHPAYLAKLFELGKMWLQLKNLTRSKSYFDQYLQRKTKKFGTVHEKTAEAHQTVGMLYYEAMQSEPALVTLQEALKIFEALASTTKNQKFLLQGQLGLIYFENCNYGKALPHYLAALKIREEMDDSFDKERSILLDYLGVTLYYRGELKKAISFFLEKLPFDSQDDSDRIICKQWLAHLYLDSGELSKCNILLHELEADPAASKKNIAHSYQLRMLLLFYKQKWPEALEFGDKALALLANEEEKKVSAEKTLIYRNFSLIYQRMGDHEKAKDYLRRIVSDSPPEQPKYFTLYRNQQDQANLRLLEGDHEAALKICGEILKQSENLGFDKSILAGSTLRLMAQTQLTMGSYKDAEANLQKALSIHQQINETDLHPDVAEDLEVLAQVKAKQGDQEKGQELLQLSRKIISQLNTE